MASPTEAFEKFEIWKTSKTSLKVTTFNGGELYDVRMGKLFFVDADACQVGISNSLVRHSFGNLVFRGCAFAVKGSRVDITRNELVWLILEEAEALLPIWPKSVP